MEHTVPYLEHRAIATAIRFKKKALTQRMEKSMSYGQSIQQLFNVLDDQSEHKGELRRAA